MDFRPIKFMASAFTPGIGFGNILKFAGKLEEIADIELEGDPNILPIPQNAPPEIPRIQLFSKDGTWSVRVSLQRTIIEQTDITLAEPNHLDSDNFCKITSSFYSGMTEELEINIQRLAFVSEGVYKSENPVELLTKSIIKDSFIGEKGVFPSGKELQFHRYDLIEWSDFGLNTWIRFKTANMDKQNEKIKVLHIEIDLNTLTQEQDPEKVFSVEEIIKYYSEIDELRSQFIDKISKAMR